MSDVASAAATFDTPAAPRATLRAAGATVGAPTLDAAAAAGKVRKATARFELASARGRKLRPGRPALIGDQATLVAARKPFSVTCAGRRMPAIALFDSTVYAVDPGLVKCARPAVVAPIALGVMVTENAARVRATQAVRGSRLTLTLRARLRIRGAMLLAGGRRVRARSRRIGGRLVITARTPARKRGKLQVVARVGKVRYSGLLPIR